MDFASLYAHDFVRVASCVPRAAVAAALLLTLLGRGPSAAVRPIVVQGAMNSEVQRLAGRQCLHLKTKM